MASITLHVRICMWKPLCCCHCNKNNAHTVPTFTSEKKKIVLSVTTVTKMPSISCSSCEGTVIRSHWCTVLHFYYSVHTSSVTNKILEIHLWRKRFMLVCWGPATTLIRLHLTDCYLPVVHLQGRWPEMTACTQTAAATQMKKSAPHTDNTHQLCLLFFLTFAKWISARGPNTPIQSFSLWSDWKQWTVKKPWWKIMLFLHGYAVENKQ